MGTAETLVGCRRLVVSPHLDDGVLSCGGALAVWAAEGHAPVVVTIFAGRPAGRLTSFARFQHERWGQTTDLVGWRRQEDQRALAQVAAQPVWLDELDCIYRGERYTTEAALFGPIAPDEAELVERVAESLMALWSQSAAATVYLPLGLGNHVDHQVAHQAGRRLYQAGIPIAWYEDFPYAIRSGGEAQRQRLTAGLVAELVVIDSVLERKIAAVAAYATQVPVLFGSTVAMPAALREYANAVGAGRSAERFWLVESLAADY